MGARVPTVPAIVLARGHTGVGMLRALAMAKIPAYAACPPSDLMARSRWYRPVPAPGWNGDLDANTDQLLADLPLPRAVILPGADDAAMFLSRLPGTALGERYPVSSSSRRTLETLQDKSRFAAYLAESSIPHPRSFSVESAADISRIPFDELDRVFIKPADSQRFSKATQRKGIWASDRASFQAAWSELHAQGLALLAQEYVPGGSDQHYFVDGFRDRHGGLAGLLARRRLRIFPPDFGNSSYCTSIALEEVPDAVESITRLLSDLDYRGIFSAEFKRDARDGSMRILEVNTRAWWYVEFAARCGVNVCEMAHADALALALPAAPSYRTGAGCVSLTADLMSAWSQPPRQRDPILQLLRQWMRAHFHLFRWDDPGPAMKLLWQVLRARLAGTRRHLSRHS
jgi:D-aspartate ligase